MDFLFSKRITIAPQLSRRRFARVYFFPWVQTAAAVALGAFGRDIGTPRAVVVAWVGCIFICTLIQDLTVPPSRTMRFLYWLLAEKLRLIKLDDLYTADKTQVYNPYPLTFLPEQRHHISWISSLVALLLTWQFALYQSHLVVATLASDYAAAKSILVLLLLTFGAIPYGTLVAGPMGYVSRHTKIIVWLSLAFIGALVTAASLRPLVAGTHATIFGSCVIFLLYMAVFVSQRLWAGQQSLQEVVRDVSFAFLSWAEASKSLNDVPRMVGEKLHHDRVFLLVADPDDLDYLWVEGEWGDCPSVKGEKIPIHKSLTGKALQTKQSVIWNDVTKCPYYYPSAATTKTRAEIAVPILHNGIVYGVLDVQAQRRNVYGPGDVQVLETVAYILGAAIAVDKRDYFFDKAVDLLEGLVSVKAALLSSEQEAFSLFASFAQRVLGADLAIYFPLSLTGCPVHPPLTKGHFNRPDLLKPPLNDPQSSLVELIAKWKPQFEKAVTTTSTNVPSAVSDDNAFVQREGIASMCFVPVGLVHEPQGALFLNFRQPKHFDTRFKFTVLSLAQSLARITSQLRYRSILLEGFGRPELGLHNLIGRHGLKEGMTQKAKMSWRECGADCCDTLEECVLYQVIHEMDDFLHEASMVESSIPPNFWRDDLERHLRRHVSNRPGRHDGRRPNLELKIDRAIERENAWMKLALYRLITEAINNAIFHGDAANINVTVARHFAAITVSIINDGLPLPPDADQKEKSKHGIYSLRPEFLAKLGAEPLIRAGPQGKGTIVTLTVPALPMRREEDVLWT